MNDLIKEYFLKNKSIDTVWMLIESFEITFFIASNACAPCGPEFSSSSYLTINTVYFIEEDLKQLIEEECVVNVSSKFAMDHALDTAPRWGL